MSAKDRDFAMQEGFVIDALAMTVQLAGSNTAVPYLQLGGGSLSDGEKVYCFSVPSGKRSLLAVLKIT